MAIGDSKVSAGKSSGRDQGFAAAPTAPVLGAAKPLSELAMTLPVLRLALGLLSATLILAGLYLGRDILVPLALAALLGSVLYRLVTRLRRIGVPRILAVVVVVKGRKSKASFCALRDECSPPARAVKPPTCTPRYRLVRSSEAW